MRYLPCLIVIFGLVASGITDITDLFRLNIHEKKEFRGILENCTIEVGVSEEELNVFENIGNDVPKKVGCLLDCYARGIGSLKPDGSYDLSMFTDKISAYNFEIVKQCFEQTRSDDPCTHMIYLFKCYLASAQKDEPYILFDFPPVYHIFYKYT